MDTQGFLAKLTGLFHAADTTLILSLAATLVRTHLSVVTFPSSIHTHANIPSTRPSSSPSAIASTSSISPLSPAFLAHGSTP